MKRAVYSILLTLLLAACAPHGTQPIDNEIGVEAIGGPSTVYDVSVNAFGNPSPVLTTSERNLFVLGNAFFRTNWVTAPATTTSRDGLGPLYLASSCSGCHAMDGRGRPPLTSDEIPTSLLFRLSTHAGADEEPHYGGQFATRAILGVAPEGRVVISYEEKVGRYADGTSFSLRMPTYRFVDLAYGAMEPSVEVSPRIAQQLIGLGLLESVDEVSLQMIAAHQVSEGVEGHFNRANGRGRFGWKARQPTVNDQTAAAFAGDIGITSTRHPTDDLTEYERSVLGPITNGGMPELEDEMLAAVTFYTQMLAVPARRNVSDPVVRNGEISFTRIGCASCHVPSLHTGISAVHDTYSNVTIYPYTDLLLHDMGADLADNRPDGDATGREWRTPPLWGIGLIPIVNGHSFLLHDGRARSIEEAILWHGGQGGKARDSFMILERSEREALLAFLRSL